VLLWQSPNFLSSFCTLVTRRPFHSPSLSRLHSQGMPFPCQTIFLHLSFLEYFLDCQLQEDCNGTFLFVLLCWVNCQSCIFPFPPGPFPGVHKGGKPVFFPWDPNRPRRWWASVTHFIHLVLFHFSFGKVSATSLLPPIKKCDYINFRIFCPPSL